MSDACLKYTGGQGATIAIYEPIISHNFSMFLKSFTSVSKEFCLVFGHLLAVHLVLVVPLNPNFPVFTDV